MNDTVIAVRGLGKRYTIGARQPRYQTLRDILVGVAASPARRVARLFGRQPAAERDPDFWAVRDVDFDVPRGEVVGVIGRNGAGKSTLLKLLSRITDPTTGEIRVRGRVGCLLEVGTGFHLELTGRENVYLNGAILGMRRREIDRKFDEIVAFSETAAFIDTPVKHYSSGMHLKLAFSVAAYLEPEILLVDEVLAVGDLAFQRKCLGKMENIAAAGRTVLFVSHNLAVVKELCHTSIVMKDGRLDFRGSVVDGLARYSRGLVELDETHEHGRTGWSFVRIDGALDGATATIRGDAGFCAEARLDAGEDFRGGRLFCLLYDAMGNLVVHRRVHSDSLLSEPLAAGRYRVRVDIPALWLAPGVYTVHFKFIGQTIDGPEQRHLSERVILDVTGDIEGISRANLVPPLSWTMTAETAVG
jgi:lipopolysaccharide transport system ATP-binding protein